MVYVLGALSLAIIVGGAIFSPSSEVLPFILGVLLTMGVNLLRVKMLDHSVNTALGLEVGSAANYLQLQYLLRFVLTGAVLILAALSPYVNLWGAALGILTWPLATYALRFFIKTDSEGLAESNDTE